MATERQYMHRLAEKGYPEFLEGYRELVQIGEQFGVEKIFKTWRITRFAEVKDGLAVYLYRNFPEVYARHFVREPILPQVSRWHYVLHNVFYVSESLLNRVWWPKYGSRVEEYMQFYMRLFATVVADLERVYEVPTGEMAEVAAGVEGFDPRD